MSLALLALAGGGAVVVASKPLPAVPPPGTESALGHAVEAQPTVGNGAAPGATTTQLRRLPDSFIARRNLIMASTAAPPPVPTVDSRWGLTQPTNLADPNLDPVIREKLAAIEALARDSYNKLSADAKRAGAKAASEQLGLDPPLSGDEDYETMAKIVGGAAGAAALGWIPGGQVLGPIVGAWLGVKLEELLAKNVDEIEDWFSSKWGAVKDAVSDAYNAVTDYFADTF